MAFTGRRMLYVGFVCMFRFKVKKMSRRVWIAQQRRRRITQRVRPISRNSYWAVGMPCRIPSGFCQRKLLQITAEEIGRFSMRAATGRGSMPRVYCHISTHYIVHCVATSSCQRGMNCSYCVLLDTLYQRCILG
jgi:hypothetical protein